MADSFAVGDLAWYDNELIVRVLEVRENNELRVGAEAIKHKGTITRLVIDDYTPSCWVIMANNLTKVTNPDLLELVLTLG